MNKLLHVLVVFSLLGITSAIEPDVSRLLENMDGYNTVTDTDTGLVWKINQSGDISRSEAARWIMELGDDWRFPTVDEPSNLYAAGIHDGSWGPFDIPGGPLSKSSMSGGRFIWTDETRQTYDGYSEAKFVIMGCNNAWGTQWVITTTGYS